MASGTKVELENNKVFSNKNLIKKCLDSGECLYKLTSFKYYPIQNHYRCLTCNSSGKSYQNCPRPIKIGDQNCPQSKIVPIPSSHQLKLYIEQELTQSKSVPKAKTVPKQSPEMFQIQRYSLSITVYKL